MANFERSEPRADSRRAFDGGETEDQDEEEGSRHPLLLVIGLLVVAAFAGVVYLAYTQGVQRGRADAPRMLVGANGPVKVAPDNPGGVETPFKGLKIYQQPAPADDEDADSTPQPTPKAAAPQKPAAAPVVPGTNALASGDDEDAGAPAATPAAAAPRVTTQPPHALTPPPKAQSEPVLKPAAESAPSEPPVKVAAISRPSAGGTAALQIGAYKSEDEANAAWHAFAHKHPIVGDYASEVRKVDLGDKGIWYRLRLGGFADKGAAVAFCDRLKADGGNCFWTK